MAELSLPNHSLEQTRDSAGLAQRGYIIGDEGGLLSSKPLYGVRYISE